MEWIKHFETQMYNCEIYFNTKVHYKMLVKVENFSEKFVYKNLSKNVRGERLIDPLFNLLYLWFWRCFEAVILNISTNANKKQKYQNINEMTREIILVTSELLRKLPIESKVARMYLKVRLGRSSSIPFFKSNSGSQISWMTMNMKFNWKSPDQSTSTLLVHIPKRHGSSTTSKPTKAIEVRGFQSDRTAHCSVAFIRTIIRQNIRSYICIHIFAPKDNQQNI